MEELAVHANPRRSSVHFSRKTPSDEQRSDVSALFDELVKWALVSSLDASKQMHSWSSEFDLNPKSEPTI